MVQLINDLTDGTRKLALLHHQFRVLRGEFWIERSDASQQYLFEIVFRVELRAPNSLIVGVLHYGCRRFCRREQLIRELSIVLCGGEYQVLDRKSTRLNSSHGYISYAVFCLKKKKK